VALIAAQEKRWIAACAAVLILLHGLPIFWGLLSPPEGWQLYRPWTYGGDYTQYRAAMEQGYNGAWLIVNRLSPEPHTPILQYPLYVFLGHVARVLRLPLEVLYTITSTVAAVALAFALYSFAAAFLPKARQRRLAFLLALSAGPAWLIIVIRTLIPSATWLVRYDNAFSRPEVNTFLLFSAAPHLPLALAILLYSTAVALRQTSSSTKVSAPRFVLYYVLFPLLLGLLNPFSLPTLLLPLSLLWLIRSFRSRRVLWLEAGPLLIMGLTILPLFLYNVWVFSQDPFWARAYGTQNFQISFPPDVMLIGYGLAGILAIAGALRAWRDEPTQRKLLLWIVVVLLMGYLPVRYQRRFSLGLAPALAVIAVVGWEWAARRYPVRRWWLGAHKRVIFSTLLILLLWGQNLLFYAAQARSYMGNGTTPYSVFQPRALSDAAALINASGEGAVVLTCEDLGNILAGEIRGRVVLGHSGATLDVETRRKEVSELLAGVLPQQAQQAYMQKHGVTHVLTSEVEPLTCGPDYIPGPEWSLDFSHGGIRVYGRTP
jgi:hypothetical protein